MPDEYLLKICAIGSGSVGKTSLIRRFAEGKFTTNYLPTLGVDITTKQIQVDNNNVKLILVDTAGQEFFGKLRPSYYRGASACLIMFALNEKPSFEAIPDWLAEFRKHIPEASVPIALAGNKKDLEEQRQISTDEANTLATTYNMTYYETSAKLGGEEIEEIFVGLTRRVLQTKQQNNI
ncbi:MAG: GTP-binding protein [Candidatus Heimdallarchaeota archaeon]|nr:MAG: GTP-binding protein [Candidatus Heimdallarchaeota archaeon]